MVFKFSHVTKEEDHLLKKGFSLSKVFKTAFEGQIREYRIKTSVAHTFGNSNNTLHRKPGVFDTYKGHDFWLCVFDSWKSVKFDSKKNNKIEMMLDYSITNYNCVFYFNNKLDLGVNLGTKVKEFGFALDLAVNLRDRTVSAYHAAASWERDNYRGALKHQSVPGTLIGNLAGACSYRINDNNRVAGEFLIEQQKEFSLQVGVEHIIDSHRTVKAKLDGEGSLGLALKHKLSEHIEVSSSANVDVRALAKNFGPVMEFGFVFKVNQ